MGYIRELATGKAREHSLYSEWQCAHLKILLLYQKVRMDTGARPDVPNVSANVTNS